MSARILMSRAVWNCANWARRNAICIFGSARDKRAAYNGGRGIQAKYGHISVETLHLNNAGDIADNLQHSMLALPAAEKRKHVNGPVERPLTIFIKQTLDIPKH